MSTKSKHNHSLLGTLQKLYSRFVVYFLHARQNRYRSGEPAGEPFNFQTQLDESIKKLAAVRKNLEQNTGSRDTTDSDGKPITNEANQRVNPAALQLMERMSEVTGQIHELSRHIRQNSKNLDLPPDTGEKLQKSTWEHLHLALRSARQGSEPLAQLHAKIASQALMEASHYMSRDEYLSFTAQVREALASIQQVH